METENTFGKNTLGTENTTENTVGALSDDKWFEAMCQIFNFNIKGTGLLNKVKDLSGRGQFTTPYGWYVTNGPLVMCCDIRVKKLNETEAPPEILEMLELLRSAKYINLSRKEATYAKRHYKEARKQWIEQSGEKRLQNTPEMRIQLQESNLFNFRLYRMPQGYSFSSVYLHDALTVVESATTIALGIVPIYGKEIPILRIWGSRGLVWLWPRHREAGLIAESVRNVYNQVHTVEAEMIENETAVESIKQAEPLMQTDSETDNGLGDLHGNLEV